MELKETSFEKGELLKIVDFNDDTKKIIEESDFLILPKMGFRSSTERGFYSESTDFYKFVVANDDSAKIGFCENEGDIKVLSLHNEDIWLPILLTSKELIIPLLNLTILYIKYKFHKPESKKIHFRVYVEDKNANTVKELEYEGDLKGLEEIRSDREKVLQ